MVRVLMHLVMQKRGEAKHFVSAKQIMQHDKCEATSLLRIRNFKFKLTKNHPMLTLHCIWMICFIVLI